MELRQFKYFIAVAEELSFTRAAERLHLSQPPLSRHIARLEEEVGVQLLERNKHKVSLTPAGAAFLVDARRVFDATRQAAETAKRAAQGETGKVTIGFGGTAAYTHFPSVLRAFRARFKQVQLSLVYLPLRQQMEELLTGQIDVGTLMEPVREPLLQTEFLMRDRLMAVLPRGHPLAGQASLRLSALAPYEHVLFTRSGSLGFYSTILAMCRRAGYVPKVAQESDTVESIIGLVCAGIGLSILPATTQKLRIPEVVFRPLEESYADVTFVLAWRRDNDSPALKSFIDIAGSHIPKGKRPAKR